MRQRSEHPIASQGEPCAVASFYADDRFPRVPAVAVAAGPHVYVYRSLRPFVRFTTPLIRHREEGSRRLAPGQRRGDDPRSSLRSLHDAGARLSPRSLACLPMEGEQLEDHVQRCRSILLDAGRRHVSIVRKEVARRARRPRVTCHRHGVEAVLGLGPDVHFTVTARVRLTIGTGGHQDGRRL